MFAVLDCGTTTTRVYIVDENRSILASGREKVGVRDTAIPAVAIRYAAG